MDFMQAIEDIQKELYSTANQLKRLNIAPSSYSASDGTEVSGWLIEYYDYPHVEDIHPGGTPYYRGGSWGNRHTILGEDGVLYDVIFKGSDTLENDNIITRTSTTISRTKLSSYVEDSRDPFKELRKMVQSAAMRAALD